MQPQRANVRAHRSSSDLLAGLLTEQAARPGNENGDHDDEGISVAEIRRDITGAERLDESQKQSADHGTRQIAEAADDADDKALKTEAAAHGRLRQKNRGHQKPGNARQHGAERERSRKRPVDGDTN